MSRSKFKVALLAVAVSASALLYVACGEKTSEPQAKVAQEDVKVNVTAATIPALYAAPVSFEAGVPEFGTTTATTLSFTSNDTSAVVPLFNVKTATDSASGTTTFGSCIFTVTKSTFLTGLIVGARLEVSPCEVTVGTGGKPVADTLTNVTATLKLGTAVKAPVLQLPPVTIDPVTGDVKVGTIVVGTVDIKTVTGG